LVFDPLEYSFIYRSIPEESYISTFPSKCREGRTFFKLLSYEFLLYFVGSGIDLRIKIESRILP
jgi:hypothetical protein